MTAAVLDWAVFRQAVAELRHEAGPARADLRAELALIRRSTPPPPDSAPAPEGALRVLLVEDDVAAALGARRLLEQAGHAVRVAASGPQACALLGEAPDVVVCDLGLGLGCTGLSVAREARRRLPGARVVLWSGRPDVDLEQARRDVGAAAAVAKGDPRRLIAAVCGSEVRRGT